MIRLSVLGEKSGRPLASEVPILITGCSRESEQLAYTSIGFGGLVHLETVCSS